MPRQPDIDRLRSGGEGQLGGSRKETGPAKRISPSIAIFFGRTAALPPPGRAGRPGAAQGFPAAPCAGVGNRGASTGLLPSFQEPPAVTWDSVLTAKPAAHWTTRPTRGFWMVVSRPDEMTSP